MSKISEILNNKSTFIMDFDGTIADTEPLNYLVIKELVARQGAVFTEDDFEKIVGKSAAEYLEKINEMYGTSLKVEDVADDYVDLFRERARDTELPHYKYVDKMLAKYSDRTIYIVSNQFADVIESMLERWGMMNRFKDVISCPVIKLTKQEMFSDTQKYFHTSVEECVLFEDAQRYLDFGKSVGFYTIGVENKYNFGKISADYIIHNADKE